jgi:hypothetical protein
MNANSLSIKKLTTIHRAGQMAKKYIHLSASTAAAAQVKRCD